MAKWIPCGPDFIETDVVRWREVVWHGRGRSKKSRAVNIGERVVTGEVVKDEGDGWVRVLVRRCEIVNEKTTRKLSPLSKDQEIRRKRSTIEHGSPERLLWSDESARAVLASRFLAHR